MGIYIREAEEEIWWGGMVRFGGSDAKNDK